MGLYDDGKGNIKRLKIFPNCGCNCSIKIVQEQERKERERLEKIIDSKNAEIEEINHKLVRDVNFILIFGFMNNCGDYCFQHNVLCNAAGG